MGLGDGGAEIHSQAWEIFEFWADDSITRRRGRGLTGTGWLAPPSGCSPAKWAQWLPTVRMSEEKSQTRCHPEQVCPRAATLAFPAGGCTRTRKPRVGGRDFSSMKSWLCTLTSKGRKLSFFCDVY